MAIDIKDLASKAITLGVEAALTTAKRLERVRQGVSSVYNTVADAVPVPLPRFGSNQSQYEPPTYQYEPPPRATRAPKPAPKKEEPVALNIVEIKSSTPKPAAKKPAAKKPAAKKPAAKKPAAKKSAAKKTK